MSKLLDKNFYTSRIVVIFEVLNYCHYMSKSQSYLWNRILEVNKEIKQTKDALEIWQKQLLLQVLIRQLKEDMGQEEYQNFIESSRKLLNPA